MDQPVPELQQAVEIALNLSVLDRVRLVERVMATLERDLTSKSNVSDRSLYGVWNDVTVSAADVDEARKEMLNNFPREDI